MRKEHGWLIIAMALIAGLMLMIGCSDDDDSNPTNPTPPPPGGVEDVGTISGIVQAVSGFALSGATITAGGVTSTSNQDGYFVLTSVPTGETVVAIGQTGYMPTFRYLDVAEGSSTHYADIALLPVESGTVDGGAGGQVATGDGTGSVDFVENSFVNGSGQPYAGEVTVELTAMVPEDETFYGAFPGEFAGIREDGVTEVPFVSFGFMTVNLLGEDKSPLQLADGVTANLRLTIDATKALNAPPTIPMWWFNEEDGRWYEEGEATLDGNVYSADVAHFTTWNWDLPVEDICSITGLVTDANGAPVEGARVISQGVDIAIRDEVTTNAAGVYNVRAVRNSLTDVWALAGSRASDPIRVQVGDVCPLELGEEDNLVLTVPAYSISLTWGASPSDLDSHLLIPMPWDDGYDYYHIAYYNMGNYGEDPYAALDTDDTSSYGPEIITGTRLYSGRFEYWVHTYSSDSSSSLQSSGAEVQLELGGQLWLFEAADVPLQGADPDGWWHVFDIVISGGVPTVQSVMQFQPRFASDGLYPDDDWGYEKQGGQPAK